MRARRGLRARRAGALPEHRRDGRGHGARGRRARRSSSARRSEAHPLVLAACALAGVDEVYRMGGAQAIAALAHGTETIPPVDVIVGPGQPLRAGGEARRSRGAVGHRRLRRAERPARRARRRRRRARSPRSTCARRASTAPTASSSRSRPTRPLLDALAARARGRARRPAPAVLVQTPDLDGALAFAEAFAPEHLQLIGPGAEALAPRVTRAGCLFVGAGARDRVRRLRRRLQPRAADRRRRALRLGALGAHVPPPHGGGADRRRRRPPRWPPHGAAIARAEGFEAHAESMEARIRENGAR